jgi:hypothetical protein
MAASKRKSAGLVCGGFRCRCSTPTSTKHCTDESAVPDLAYRRAGRFRSRARSAHRRVPERVAAFGRINHRSERLFECLSVMVTTVCQFVHATIPPDCFNYQNFHPVRKTISQCGAPLCIHLVWVTSSVSLNCFATPLAMPIASAHSLRGEP